MCYEKITYCIDITALVIQIIATILMFSNSPFNKPSGAFMPKKIDFEIPNKRNKRLNFGFKLLCIGFVLQMISLMTKSPF